MLRVSSTFRPRSDIGRFISAEITPAVRAGVQEVGDAILERSQALVPVDTGALKESGAVTLYEQGNVITAIVDYPIHYAGYVEFGTGIAGSSSPGAGPYPYNDSWPGMVAQPYLRPALDEVKPQAKDMIAGHVRLVL